MLALVAVTGAGGPAVAGSPVSERPAGGGLMPVPRIPGASLVPISFSNLNGWAEDDLSSAFVAFRNSCAMVSQSPAVDAVASVPTLRSGLIEACAAADALAADLGIEKPSRQLARLFFELNFRPFRVMPDTNPDAFLTGYYEPEVEGALEPGGMFNVPVYARPSDLVTTSGPSANGGGAVRVEAGREVPYYDRKEIEDGALAGRGLEIVYLKDPVDYFFMQIQGSARVRLGDGRVLRLGYDGYNGRPYTPVGKLLIQRGLVPRDEMSMDRIRAFMEADPEAGRDLRRENRSFVFFKVLDLSSDVGAIGAQGVSLTPGRSLAVDRRLHTYGSPIFVEVVLPLSGPRSADPFQRLMIAQDTGSAIVGPGRVDLYFGTGQEAGAVAGRIRHRGRIALLVPRFTCPDPARAGAP
ncbi:murein transglycosylase A [Xanthobacter agilis]|uniref:peptidoglycan lytic exotransglycosylase n=1 Tax=Xanthobacter agilis TaxID=47492 RepID=A0ABU0L8P0_XANAG|nr:MltA domain-containing protein [Xanthobacter agilis]MDQ0503504.1 membrane-bound lytic murein transglycosylase A [Xanthobacter agilis]